ncbi:MAG: ankyrin repeat domain-containing protein [Planctomycetota bacterium]
MRGRFIRQVVFCILLLFQLSICIAAESPDSNESTKYLDAVREFADNVLKHGRDTYGPKHTPLFVDGLMIYDPNDPNYGKDGVFKPVEWIAPNGDRWILSNLASQQNLFRTLDGLTKITGDHKYKQAAMEAIEYAFENLRGPNGLLYWGGHQAYDAAADKPCGMWVHEFKGFYPYYKLMWEVNPQVTKQFIEAFWSAHILDWLNLDMNRHASLTEFLEVPWKHAYKGGPVFFESRGFSVFSTGNDLCYATAMLYMLSGGREPLVWGKRLAYRYVETRNRKTGFISPVFSVMRNKGVQVKSNDEVLGKLLPVAYIFPYQGYANRALWECHFGYDRSTPGIFLNSLFAPWICQLMFGELLGEEGKEFTQWAMEELTAYGKVAYRSRDNVFIPMCLDGTSLEGYVCKEDGPLGFKGTILEPVTAGSTDFWAYALAYCQTDSEFMWEMARNIALGNNYGDLGVSATEESRLNLQTDRTDPYVIIVFLELYRKTNKQVFLEMARRMGNNVLTHRFHEGFFTPEGHTFTKLDSIDSLTLLHLHVTLTGNKSVNIPRVWPGTSFFEYPYRSKDSVDDNQLIYSLKDVSEPPISLQEAAAYGNVEAVKSMIAQGIDVDSREDSFYKTALHRAAISGRKDVVELLLAKGADIDARDLYLASALHFAVENDRKEIAELLLDRGADVNAKDYSGETPIHSAIRAGHRDIIELLLANGADINAKNNNGQTPVDIAISRNRKEIVELLIAKGADISIHSTSRFGDLAIVKSLVEKGADINAKDTSGRAALHYAVEKGHKDIVKLLIANGADVNVKDKDGSTPGHIALGENNRSMLELLIAKGANLDSIHLAAYKGDLDRVRSFIEKGADVNTTDSYGATPLHYAAVRGSKDVVEFLITRCADVNVKKKSGDTPLHWAAISGRKDVVELLIDNAANINERGRWDYTPIYYAAWSGVTEAVELLVEKGADVNAKDRWGWTPLHYMAKDDNRSMAQLIIAKGADVNAKDNSGETALSVAKEKGHTEVVELLRKHEAKE